MQLIERWTKSFDENSEQQLHTMSILHETIEIYLVKKDTLLMLLPYAMAGGSEAREIKALERQQRQTHGIEQE